MNKAIIFDFDGTLVDSEKTIYQCFQKVTSELVPDRINYAQNILIGPPLRETSLEILGTAHQNKLDKFINLFIQMHDDQIIIDTRPYPEVTEILQKLSSMDISMAIATNKRNYPTTKLIKHFGWEDHFCIVECSDNFPKTRNKGTMIKDIMNGNNIFTNSYFVGDTVNDGLSANENKLKFIRAYYGYGRDQDWSMINIEQSIEKFSELELNFI